mmetsp:Transcript_10977/g.36419  ORF Transcript_10977/g.36419 Transcript_10977/m.36419 type:complete len:255 (-) Transcript_10977:785-1549(-)|eukprot:scaffold2611_cov114-Isochrysis_galbana.AAC.8
MGLGLTFLICAAVGGRPDENAVAAVLAAVLGIIITDGLMAFVCLPCRTTRETWKSLRNMASKCRSACSCWAVSAASLTRVCWAVAPWREHQRSNCITDCMLHVARSATLSSPPSRWGDHETNRSPNRSGCANSLGRLCNRSRATTAPPAWSMSSRVSASMKRARCASCRWSSAPSQSSALVISEKAPRQPSYCCCRLLLAGRPLSLPPPRASPVETGGGCSCDGSSTLYSYTSRCRALLRISLKMSILPCARCS